MACTIAPSKHESIDTRSLDTLVCGIWLTTLKNVTPMVIEQDHEKLSVDVLIVHDSLFKDITEGVLKNEGLTVKILWAPRLVDAFSVIR